MSLLVELRIVFLAALAAVCAILAYRAGRDA
jgi:hypothetical protein